ncbi:hypothetical protein IKZ80_01640 [bacterium]|nr:hypothetical protein [bacterium]
MMKYLAIALIVLLCALCPYLLGKMSVSGIEERYRNACYELGINPRPFNVESGFLSSSLTLDEPLSSTISSMGLAPEAVDFFRDYDLSLNIDVTHGPMHFIKSAEHTVITLRGPEWQVTGEEWRTNRFSGLRERYLRLYDKVLETEGVTFCVSNFWLRDNGPGAELTAGAFSVWPGLSISGLKYVSETSEDELTSGNLSVALVSFGEGALSNLVVKVESKPVIRGGSQKDLRCEILEGTGSLGDLAGRKIEFETKDRFFSRLVRFFLDEESFESLMIGGGDD